MKKNSLGDKLTPVIEKVEKLSTVQRVLIYVGTFLLLIGGVGYFSYWPKYQRLDELKTEFEELDAKLTSARNAARQLPKLRLELAEAEARFKTVQRALPENEEIPSLLTSVSQSGRDVGLDFLLFEPDKENNKDFYAEIPVRIRVQGSYHSVGLFLDRVAHLPRIVNVIDIVMKPGTEIPGQGVSLVTECAAMTYKFVESPQPQDKKKTAPKR